MYPDKFSLLIMGSTEGVTFIFHCYWCIEHVPPLISKSQAYLSLAFSSLIRYIPFLFHSSTVYSRMFFLLFFLTFPPSFLHYLRSSYLAVTSFRHLSFPYSLTRLLMLSTSAPHQCNISPLTIDFCFSSLFLRFHPRIPQK